LFTEAGLGNTQAIVHVIGDHYGLATGELPWLIAGYSLTVGTFILISGRFGDVFGYKRMLLIGFSWMAVWSLILGLSVYSNHVLFTFARVLQGIGPAIMLPNGLAILGATYAPGRRKAMVFSIFGACAPTGSIIGSAFAGLFELGWWPWTYWSFAICLVLITVLGIYAVPDPPKKSEFADKPMMEKIRDLDLPGAVTGVTALVRLTNFFLTYSTLKWNKELTTGRFCSTSPGTKHL
jgi:MFS family permease